MIKKEINNLKFLHILVNYIPTPPFIHLFKFMRIYDDLSTPEESPYPLYIDSHPENPPPHVGPSHVALIEWGNLG